MDDVINILNKSYITRQTKKKILHIIEQNNISINDFPEELKSKIYNIINDDKQNNDDKQKYKKNIEPRNSRKRRTPDSDFDRSQEPVSKKQKTETENILKFLIEKDINHRKNNNIFTKFVFSKPYHSKTRPSKIEKDLVIIDDDDEYDEKLDEKQPIPENKHIKEDEYNPEDEEYNPEEDEEFEEFKSDIIGIFGQNKIRHKQGLDLSCIEREDEKEIIKNLYEKIQNINNVKMPLKIKVLTSHLPIKTKAMVIKKLEMFERSMDSNDGKKFDQWIESLLKIPFNKFSELPISNKSTNSEIGIFLDNFYNNLDNAIYGQKKVKQTLTETVAKWIINPSTKGHAIAIVGPPGVGKTSIVRNGLAKGLNRPFCSLSLAGMHDESYLSGFAMTYEGSQEGRISKMLMNSDCMNPIIFMDELDKVDVNRNGMGVMNKLMEITDFSQNHEFEDLYFQDVKLDLSKCIFVFSLNYLENVDPILKDRLEIIRVDGFKPKEKVKIALDYLIPSELKQFGFSKDDIIFDKKIIRYIIMQIEDEEGVRKLKEAINKICRKINMLRFTKENTEFNNIFELPITITQKIVDKILTRPDKPFLNMYI